MANSWLISKEDIDYDIDVMLNRRMRIVCAKVFKLLKTSEMGRGGVMATPVWVLWLGELCPTRVQRNTKVQF